MYKFVLFLIFTTVVFIKPLGWLWDRMADGDGWSSYLGITLSIYFLFYHDNLKNERKINFNHLSAILIILYFILPELPYLMQGLLALSFIYLGFCLCLHKKLSIHFLILACFCLPWISSFQFYFGYPLRLICSYASLMIFKLMYLPVELNGIMFLYQEKTVYIDAPCSGIKMLYLGMLFTVVLCYQYKLSIKKSFIFFLLSFLMILVANTIRYVLLFFKEANLMDLPNWMHSGIGLILFFIFNVGSFWMVTHHQLIMSHISSNLFYFKNYFLEKRL